MKESLNYRSLHILSIIIFISLTFITLRSFLLGDSFFNYRDDLWPLNIEHFISNALNVFDIETMRRLSYLGPFFLLAKLGLSSLDTEKLLFFTTRFMTGFLAYFAVYKFLTAKTMSNNKTKIFVVALACGFFYSYNPFVTEKMGAAIHGFTVSYSLIPLILYYFDRSLNHKSFLNIFVCSSLITLSIAGTMQFLVLLPLFVLMPWLMVVLVNRIYHKSSLFLPIRSTLIIIGMFLFLSAYWIVPAALISIEDKTPQPAYILTDLMLTNFSTTANWLNGFRLMGAWWPYIELNPVIPYQPWVFLTFATTILTSFFLLVTKKLKFYMLSFLAILLLVLFFFKGNNEPLSKFYELLYGIPVVGWMFRVPETNGMFLPVYFMMIIAIGSYFLLLNSKKIVFGIARYLPLFVMVFSTVIISWPMFTGNFGGIDTEKYAPPPDSIPAGNFTIRDGLVGVIGGSGKVQAVQNIASRTNNTSFTYLDKKLDFPESAVDINKIVLDDSQSLRMHLLPKDAIIVKPFDATIKHDTQGKAWSRAGTDDPLHGPFHPYLEQFGLENSDFDYGYGVLLSWNPTSLEIPVDIGHGGMYDIFLRYLENPHGGRISIDFDSNISDTSTKSLDTKFVWKKLGSIGINAGHYKLKLTNIEGLNAVNVIVLIPEDEVNNFNKNIQDFVNDKQMIYVFEPEKMDFTNDIISGKSYLLEPKGGTFTKTISKLVQPPKGSSSVDIAFSDRQDAGSQGSYTIKSIQIQPILRNNTFSLDFEDGKPAFKNLTPEFLSLSLDPNSALSGSNSLHVHVKQADRELWNIIETKPIAVDGQTSFDYRLDVLGSIVNNLHAKVASYDKDMNFLREDFIFSEPRENFKEQYSRELTTPVDARYIKLQVWVRSNPTRDSDFLLDNISVNQLTEVLPVANYDLFSNNIQDTIVAKNSSLMTIDTNGEKTDDLNSIESKQIPITDNKLYNITLTIEAREVGSLYSTLNWYSRNDMVATNQGLVINPNQKLSTNIDLLKPSSYTFAMKAKTCNTCGNLKIVLDDKVNIVSLNDTSSTFRWFYINSEFNEGIHRLSLSSKASTEIDKIVIYSDSRSKDNIATLFPSSYENVNATDDIEISPSSKVVRVDASKPFALVFSSPYSPFWSAELKGYEYRSIETQDKHNVFLIPSADSAEINVQYKPAIWLQYGSVVSTITFFIALFLLIRTHMLPKTVNSSQAMVTNDNIQEDDQNEISDLTTISSTLDRIKRYFVHFDPINSLGILIAAIISITLPFLLIQDQAHASNVAEYLYFVLIAGIAWHFILHNKKLRRILTRRPA